METTGAGAGWLDFDGDGHWDLYLNQGGDSTVDADLDLAVAHENSPAALLRNESQPVAPIHLRCPLGSCRGAQISDHTPGMGTG